MRSAYTSSATFFGDQVKTTASHLREIASLQGIASTDVARAGSRTEWDARFTCMCDCGVERDATPTSHDSCSNAADAALTAPAPTKRTLMWRDSIRICGYSQVRV